MKELHWLGKLASNEKYRTHSSFESSLTTWFGLEGSWQTIEGIDPHARHHRGYRGGA